MTPPLPPPTSHPPQPAMGVATHAPAVHPVVPPSQAAARVQRELGFLDDYAGSPSDSDDPSPPRTHSKSHKLKSGRSRTSEDIVKRQVDWPHFNVFKGPSRKAAEYDSLSIAEFVFGYLAMPSNQTPLRGTVGSCCGICVISCTTPQCTHGRASAISTASSCAWWSTMRRPGLTKHWYRSYAPNTPGHQRPPQAMEATPHSRAPAQSSREGRVPTPRIMSRPMAAGFLMSVAGASVSGGSTISMRRRTVSLKRNGTQKTRKPGNTHLTLCSDDPWWWRPSPCGLTYSLW